MVVVARAELLIPPASDLLARLNHVLDIGVWLAGSNVGSQALVGRSNMMFFA